MTRDGKLFMPMTKNKFIYLQAPWIAPSNIHTQITTVHNGCNPALHTGEDRAKVLAHREQIRQHLPAEPLWLNQTHSTTVINWDNTCQTDSPLDADAAITTQAGKICVVMTADCLPILLTNQQGDFVAAIHAGWRGLNAGIITNTLNQLHQFTTNKILAFIGPAINQECFEVGNEVRENFVTRDNSCRQFFIPAVNPDKWLAHLRGIAAHWLIAAGLSPKNISNPPICTKCTPEWFYSYRADPNSGRIATMIWKD